MHEKISSFHYEFLEFLQRDVELRCANEGVDLRFNQEIQTFIQGLNPSDEGGPLALEEIIENYHYLFGAKGPLHLEKTLLEAFPAKDFIALGLTRYYPRVYRGLPRLYHKHFPSQSHIKKNFTHVPSLKKLIASKALFSLYSKLPAKGKVTIFTWVINDGLGDYIAAIEVLHLLKGRFPELTLHLVALVYKGALGAIALPEEVLLIPYEKESSFSLITPEALQLLRESDLILQMPTFYPHTDELIAALPPSSKMELIGQYGYLESSWFHPKSGGYSMGLHFLERGILIRKPCFGSWEDVKNESLQKWRRTENHFYLAYLTSSIGGAIYLHALLKSLENDIQDIDICVPDLGWFIQFIEKQNETGAPILEWDLGVESIEVYFNDQIHSMKLAGRGKKVRLLCPGTISQSDFRILLHLSSDFVAVRGDQSFSEAVSEGKAFFYDAREHACYFVKDLVALSSNRLHEFEGTLACIRGMGQAFLYNVRFQISEWVDESYFQEMEEWTSIALSIGLALQDPKTKEGFLKLNRILAEEFSANAFICQLVQRALCHKNHPEIGQLESAELALFISKGQSFRQMIESQKKWIGDVDGSVSKDGK